MAGEPISTVIGVFSNHDQANRAIDELRRNNFSYDRIRFVQHGTGSFFDNLKGMFTGQASVASNTADVLMKMGMPEYEAHHYQQELDANHVLLLMNADDRPEEAFNIMRQNGAFDINSRLRTAPLNALAETRSPKEVQETPDVPPSTNRSNVSPSTLKTDTVPEVSSPDIPPPTSNPDLSVNRSNTERPVETPRNA